MKPAAKSNDKISASVVYVIDDDASVREGLGSLVRPVDLRVETFAPAQEFLRHQMPEAPACLVLDVRLPGLSGTRADLAQGISGQAFPHRSRRRN